MTLSWYFSSLAKMQAGGLHHIKPPHFQTADHGVSQFQPLYQDQPTRTSIILMHWGFCLHTAGKADAQRRNASCPQLKRLYSQQPDPSSAGICTAQNWAQVLRWIPKINDRTWEGEPTCFPMSSVSQFCCIPMQYFKAAPITLQKYYLKSTTQWCLEIPAVVLTNEINVLKLNQLFSCQAIFIAVSKHTKCKVQDLLFLPPQWGNKKEKQ